MGLQLFNSLFFHEVLRLICFSTSQFYRTRGILSVQDIIITTSHCRFANLGSIYNMEAVTGTFCVYMNNFLLDLPLWTCGPALSLPFFPQMKFPGFLFFSWQTDHWDLPVNPLSSLYFSSGWWLRGAWEKSSMPHLVIHVSSVMHASLQ